MPLWLTLALAGIGLAQSASASSAQQRALEAAQQGNQLSAEELAQMESQGTSALKGNLAQRGLLDSSLFTGGLAKLRGELALAKAKGRGAFQGSYISQLLNRSNQPSLLSTLVPLSLQYGVRGRGENDWIIPRWSPTGN